MHSLKKVFVCIEDYASQSGALAISEEYCAVLQWNLYLPPSFSPASSFFPFFALGKQQFHNRWWLFFFKSLRDFLSLCRCISWWFNASSMSQHFICIYGNFWFKQLSHAEAMPEKPEQKCVSSWYGWHAGKASLGSFCSCHAWMKHKRCSPKSKKTNSVVQLSIYLFFGIRWAHPQ